MLIIDDVCEAIALLLRLCQHLLVKLWTDAFTFGMAAPRCANGGYPESL
ncbi:MAG: hypothetical protein GDA56_21020 [Hormoscilla sp. GM7CHS1pb]|nr:hypothetical protein [Hormoscilla sp. GM7CHS1pb]